MRATPQSLRAYVYDVLLARGLPPTCADIGAHFGESEATVRSALAALKLGKTILLKPDGSEIWMCGAFSAVPTAFRVVGKSAAWWANCIWDAFAVAVIANEPVHIATHCADCNEPMQLHGEPARPPEDDGSVAHFLVPAKHWYDDLGFT